MKIVTELPSWSEDKHCQFIATQMWDLTINTPNAVTFSAVYCFLPATTSSPNYSLWFTSGIPFDDSNLIHDFILVT